VRLVLKLLLVQYQQKSQVLENNIYAAAQMPEVLVTQLNNAVMMQRCQDRFESLPLSISTSRLSQLSTFKVLRRFPVAAKTWHKAANVRAIPSTLATLDLLNSTGIKE
jgi:hypothetical protein